MRGKHRRTKPQPDIEDQRRRLALAGHNVGQVEPRRAVQPSVTPKDEQGEKRKPQPMRPDPRR